VSQKTADLLTEAGKGHWVSARDTLVSAKGKGMLQTYWVDPVAGCATSASGSTEVSSDVDLTERNVEGALESVTDEKINRMIDWYVEALATLLRDVPVPKHANGLDRIDGIPRDQISDTIKLSAKKTESLELSTAVMQQLREYVSTIAHMYKNNPFHNFEHATRKYPLTLFCQSLPFFH
jgi:hypothetical protein